jgi:hypothetical protein
MLPDAMSPIEQGKQTGRRAVDHLMTAGLSVDEKGILSASLLIDGYWPGIPEESMDDYLEAMTTEGLAYYKAKTEAAEKAT